jgi:hypothetical protein
MMIATWRLSKHIAAHDFFTWLVMVQSAGATKIVFDTQNPKQNKWPKESVMKRFHSIIEPGPALAGLPCQLGSNDGIDANYTAMVPWVNAGNTFRRLQSVKAPVKSNFTVTIRNNHDDTTRKPHSPERNSNPDIWYRFAEEIGATLIEDNFVKPIHLHDRMALYAGAQMNFGVLNGPIYMLSLTAYPMVMMVNNAAAESQLRKWPASPGQSFPWLLKNQTMFWEHDDDIDNLRRMFDKVVPR